jgi:hypothetical protein
MAQIFHPSMNTVARVTIFGGVFILAGATWAASLWVRSSYVTKVDVVRDQPVPFSHDHHVSGLGLDCRYCHTTVEQTAFAGLPATEICMGCHSQIWKDSPLLEPVRESFRTGEPLHWTRVHDLPDFVYFNHSIHIAKGIGCESCHGRVDRMPLMRKATRLYMEWCLDCHRHPEVAVRDSADIFRFGLNADKHVGIAPETVFENSKPVGGSTEVSADEGTDDAHPGESEDDMPLLSGQERVKHYGIVKKQLTDCWICHR